MALRTLRSNALITIFAFTTQVSTTFTSAATKQPQWTVVSSSSEPVIGPAQSLPHGIYQGFETGQYMKVGSTHYYVANELGLCENIIWDRTTRAGLWSAPNGSGPWTRVTSL